MPVKFIDRPMVGFMPVLESVEGDYLLCGRTLSDGAVFDHFHEALACMNAEIEDNRKAFRSRLRRRRKVKVAKVVEFEGLVSCFVPSDESEPHA